VTNPMEGCTHFLVPTLPEPTDRYTRESYAPTRTFSGNPNLLVSSDVRASGVERN
jgi:hypothetical protein